MRAGRQQSYRLPMSRLKAATLRTRRAANDAYLERGCSSTCLSLSLVEDKFSNGCFPFSKVISNPTRPSHFYYGASFFSPLWSVSIYFSLFSLLNHFEVFLVRIKLGRPLFYPTTTPFPTRTSVFLWLFFWVFS